MVTGFAHTARATALCLAAALMGCATPSAAPPARSAEQTQSLRARWNAAALQEVLNYARTQKTTGFLIVQHGQVVAEQNWPLPADATAFRAAFVHGQAGEALLEDVASQQKSFIALLMGVAVDRGLLDIDRPVSALLGAGWSKAEASTEARITVRHLLEMTSGLGEDLRSEAEPGARFFYNTPAYAFTKRVLEQVARLPLDELTRTWLAQPLGMHDTAWRQRPPALADVGNPTGLVTTPSDIAKIGRLLLDRGLAPNGQRVISTAQLDAMLARTPGNPAYGRLWWLNGGSHALRAGPGAPRQEGFLIASAPADLVAALGAHDRKLYVVPSLDLIVVRTGQAAPVRDFDQQLWLRLMQAVPTKG
jgi:CubicO group peptidase (beta-lactamase class C family)